MPFTQQELDFEDELSRYYAKLKERGAQQGTQNSNVEQLKNPLLKYAPMLQLLSDEELMQVPPSQRAKFRRKQAKLYRQYLRELKLWCSRTRKYRLSRVDQQRLGFGIEAGTFVDVTYALLALRACVMLYLIGFSGMEARARRAFQRIEGTFIFGVVVPISLHQ